MGGAGGRVQGGVRRGTARPAGVTPVVTGDLAEAAPPLAGIDVVIHAAGLGHRRGLGSDVWRRENVTASVKLAEAARDAGVRRFVLVSSAYVLGRVHDGAVTDSTPPRPMDDYAASKLEAERALAEILGNELTVLRPAAVIGPRCPGNLKLLIRLLRRGVPLPFAGIRNRRSFIDRSDLGRLALAVAGADAPPGVVLAAHPEATSTPDLIRALAEGLGVKARLLPCPPALLAAGAIVLGRGAMWQSLAGDFAAAPAAALALGWTPAANLAEQLVQTSRYDSTTTTKP